MATKTGAGLIRHATRCLLTTERFTSRSLTRAMATETFPTTPITIETPPLSTSTTANDESLSSTTGEPMQTTLTTRIINPLQHIPPPNPFIIPVQCTLYSFPELEPTGFHTYFSTQLMVPLRKDLLHMAVTFEADASRQGTASTKWRGDVHGSGRKLRPQKGSGRARVGDAKSPTRRGGGVAFGPHPRDFSTELPKQKYDIAWRSALSYRYRRGQLIVIDGHADVENVHPGSRVRYLQEMLKWHNMGHSNARTLIVTDSERPAMVETFKDEKLLKHGELLVTDEVDVKDLLELGRIMIEKSALSRMLKEHRSDLPAVQYAGVLQKNLEQRQTQAPTITTSSQAS